MSKIYDCVPFFNELDLLEIRLELMYDKVDYFIISECDFTFSGLKKPFYFDENRNRFKKYLDKIIHLKHENMDEYVIPKHNYDGRKKDIFDNILKRLEFMRNSSKTEYGKPHWCRDFFHKEMVMIGMDNCQPEDIILFGDLDEIPNPDKLILNGEKFVLEQNNMIYFINTENGVEKWYGTLICRFKDLYENSCMFSRDNRLNFPKIENGGWHLTFMGGEDRIIEKIISWGHQEFNTSYIKNSVSFKLSNNIDIIDRPFQLKDKNMKDLYPDTIIELVENKYPYLIKNKL